MIVKNVHQGSLADRRSMPSTVQFTSRLRALSSVIINPSLLGGVTALIQCTGYGKLAPNTVVVDFPEDWKQRSDEEIRVRVWSREKEREWELSSSCIRLPVMCLVCDSMKFDLLVFSVCVSVCRFVDASMVCFVRGERRNSWQLCASASCLARRW